MAKKKLRIARRQMGVSAKGKGHRHAVILPQDRTLVDMRMFFRSQDWSQLWEKWYLSVDSTGRRKYFQLRSFVKDIAQSKEQMEFLLWYLGPKEYDNPADDPQQPKYPFVPAGPVDWVEKRQTGGWFHDKSMRVLAKDITRRMNALEALRETGNQFGVAFLARAAKLAEKLDAHFQGELFLPDLDQDSNLKRARVYLGLHQDILRYYGEAQALYAKAHGVNFEDMSGLVHLMEATQITAVQQGQMNGELTPEQRAVRQLVEMTLVKAAKYKLPLPADAEAKIVDAVVLSDSPDPKKKVQ